MAKLLSWNSQYSVDVPEIDAEHQKIISMINDLYHAIDSRDAAEGVSATLHALVDYTQTHFNHEEKMMREAGFPGYREHVAAHEHLVLDVMRLAETHKNGDVAALADELISLLYDWLVEHILEMDRQYVPYLRAKPAVMS